MEYFLVLSFCFPSVLGWGLLRSRMFYRGAFCSFECRSVLYVGVVVCVEGGECEMFLDVHVVVLFVYVMLYAVNIVLIVVYRWMGALSVSVKASSVLCLTSLCVVHPVVGGMLVLLTVCVCMLAVLCLVLCVVVALVVVLWGTWVVLVCVDILDVCLGV